MASAASAQTDVPNVFQAGQPARAAEVNENFDTLESAIDLNASDIQQIAGLAGLSPEAAQIQTGLAVPSSYQNNYVTELVVSEFGVITIRFGNKANAKIAGKTMRWRPIFTDAVIRWVYNTVETQNIYMPDECRT